MIASVTQPFCGDCTRARISAEGKLFTCLFAVRGNDLRALIRSGASDDELARGRARHLGRPHRPLLRPPLGRHGRPRQGRDELHRRLTGPNGRVQGTVPGTGLKRLRVPNGADLAIDPNGGCRHPQARLESTAVSTVVAAGRRHLPRGWSDLGRQLAIWFGFAVLYQLARGVADRKPPSVAFAHGRAVVDLETRLTHRLYELTLQNFVDQRHLLGTAVSWTYWNSEFTVVGLAVLWVYLRRHDAFSRFRNSILLANMIGLVGYVLMPTAPPRLLGLGFVDEHRDGLVSLAANPYAAMPSLHAADALIVGVVLCSVTRALVGEGDLDRVARLGLVRRDGDRQPLLARLHRRYRRRADLDGRGLQRPRPGRVCRSSAVTDRLPTRSESRGRARCYGPAREQSSRDQARLHVRSARPRHPAR